MRDIDTCLQVLPELVAKRGARLRLQQVGLPIGGGDGIGLLADELPPIVEALHGA